MLVNFPKLDTYPRVQATLEPARPVPTDADEREMAIVDRDQCDSEHPVV